MVGKRTTWKHDTCLNNNYDKIVLLSLSSNWLLSLGAVWMCSSKGAGAVQYTNISKIEYSRRDLIGMLVSPGLEQICKFYVTLWCKIMSLDHKDWSLWLRHPKGVLNYDAYRFFRKGEGSAEKGTRKERIISTKNIVFHLSLLDFHVMLRRNNA